ncbi:MAG: FHA domain-containing protein [Pelolinea sp.]|nr:FHA domain-containing protein [Pelolinea sp.]
MAIIAKLIIRSGVLAGNEKNLNSDLLRIGRDPANDFIVDDIEVSRNHAKITCIDDIYKIEDLNSTNGTFINGRQINQPEKLKDGDLISLGENNVLEFSSKKESAKVELAANPEQQAEKKELKGFFSRKKGESDFKSLEIERAPEEGKKNFFKGLSKLPTWAIVLLIALGFLILFCIIPLIFIEITNQWCSLFSGFFNAISSGVCP